MDKTSTAVAARLENLRKYLKEKNLDAALVTKRENYIYLSGFNGTSAYLMISQDDAILVTDFRYVEQASEQAPLFKVVQYQGSLMTALNDILKGRDISALAFEESYLTYERYNEFKTKLNVKEFKPLEGIIEKLRMVKDPVELEIIRKAVKIADEAFSHILSCIKPGVAETELAAELEYKMKVLGARGASFDTIIASGKRASMPHGVASEKKLEMGDVITLDFGALYSDYCSDMTRTVFLGEPDPELKKIYNIVLEAQLKSIEGARAGLTGKEVDSIARRIINDSGHEKDFGHGLGHGVGLEIPNNRSN